MGDFTPAAAAEILRSSQKDDQYALYLRNELSEFVQNTIGVRHLLRCREKLDVLCDFAYYFVTVASGFQTLGEEYVHIIQVDKTLKRLPSTWRRLLFVLLQTCSPLVIKSILTRLQRLNLESSQNANKTINVLLSVIQDSNILIQGFHLAIFYLSGQFSCLSKRITGIRYVLLRHWLYDSSFQLGYTILGWLTLIQLSITMFIKVCQYYKQVRITTLKESYHLINKRKIEEECEIEVHERCCLCLDQCSQPTCTPCGHLFCWACIMEWISYKMECPLCREKCIPSRLVFLQNYGGKKLVKH